MVEVDEFDLGTVRDFLGQNWADFVAFNEERAEDGQEEAQRIYEAIGGEPE
jgi:hypothetical protein